MNSQRIVEQICAAPTELLLMSRKACHTSNVSSIVFAHSPLGGLHRAFLAWPGHLLTDNHLHGALTVGIHNHRYALRLRRISGDIVNTNYYEGAGRSSRELNKWKFMSGEMKQAPVTKLIGTAAISKGVVSPIKEQWLELSVDTLHDIHCSGAAAWEVQEGAIERDFTTLYSSMGSIDTRGFYEPFDNRDEVIAHVEEFFMQTRC